MPDAEINGVRLTYEENGEGDPILFIPGGGSDARAMIFLTAPWAARHRVICLDSRGAGRSDVPEGPYTTAGMADEAAGLLDILGLPKAHVVGHSMGAAIAQELSLNTPERIDRLVLISPWARLRKVSQDFFSFLEHAMVQDPPIEGVWLATFPWFAGPAFMSNNDLVEMAVAPLSRPRSARRARGVASQLAASRVHDSSDRLEEIGVPTLVLTGADDVISPTEEVRAMAARIPGAQLVVVDRAGHGVIYEQADAVNAALLGFLGGKA